ncbi:MAG: tetratricopeptide repeat protein [Candidatus Aenigmarchaeota archaeon]|nr:tetratricopeptide repeat protein [Candidatus Aenigmarchaeota archaeon]
MARKSLVPLIKKIIELIGSGKEAPAPKEFRKLLDFKGEFNLEETDGIYEFGRVFGEETCKKFAPKFISEIDKLIKKKKTPNLYFIKSEIVCNCEKPEDTLKVLNNMLKVYPKHPELLNTKAQILKDLNRPEEALREIEKALNIEDHPVYHNTKALILKDLNRPEEALREIDKALKIKDSPAIHNTKAAILQDLNRPEEALKEINKAIDLKDHPAYHNTKALILKDLNRPEEALKEIEKALEIKDSPAYHNTKALILKDLNRPEEALREIEKALNIEDHPASHNTKAAILQDLNRPEEALEEINLAVEGETKSPVFLGNKVHILLGLGKLKTAKETLSEALRYAPENEFLLKTKDVLKNAESLENTSRIINERLEEREKKLNEKIETAKEELNKKIEAGNVKLVEFLGVFAAIIAFILSSINILSTDLSLCERLILIVGLGSVLVLFILLIEILICERKDGERLYVVLAVLLAFIGLLVSASISGFCPSNHQTQSQDSCQGALNLSAIFWLPGAKEQVTVQNGFVEGNASQASNAKSYVNSSY